MTIALTIIVVWGARVGYFIIRRNRVNFDDVTFKESGLVSKEMGGVQI